MKPFVKHISIILIVVSSANLFAQKTDPLKPDFSKPKAIPGMNLVWSDEFNTNGKPNPANWSYETGFVRNRELQWYQSENANCINGVLLIEGKKTELKNPNYNPASTDWKTNREYISYTSSSLRTRGLQQWQFGRFEIRARIDTAQGSWPAIWTLGATGGWPSGGEIDIMEFYRVNGEPTILANVAWGGKERSVAVWDTQKIPLSKFLEKDKDWVKKFHVWKMEWNKEGIKLFLDDELLNTTTYDQTINGDGSNPFLKPEYLLLNLALGANGADPAKSEFPIKYEVDYVRVFQEKQ